MSDVPAAKANERPLYRLTLRPEPDVDGTRALRQALKVLLRQFGLRCLGAEELAEPGAKPSEGG